MNKPCKNHKLCLAKEIIFRKSPEVLGINPIGFLSKEPTLMPTSRFSYKNTSSLQHYIHWNFKTIAPCIIFICAFI